MSIQYPVYDNNLEGNLVMHPAQGHIKKHWGSIVQSMIHRYEVYQITFYGLEPQLNWSQHKTYGTLMHDNSRVIRLLLHYVITSVANLDVDLHKSTWKRFDYLFRCQYAGRVKRHNACKRHVVTDTGVKQTECTIFLHVISMEVKYYFNCFQVHFWRNYAQTFQ